MDSNPPSRHERAGFCCGRRIAGPSAGSQKGFFFLRYRWFESISLQRGVLCEPGDPKPPSRPGATGCWAEDGAAVGAVRSPARTSAPSSDGFVEMSVILRPIRDPIPGLGNPMAMSMVFERQGEGSRELNRLPDVCPRPFARNQHWVHATTCIDREALPQLRSDHQQPVKTSGQGY